MREGRRVEITATDSIFFHYRGMQPSPLPPSHPITLELYSFSFPQPVAKSIFSRLKHYKIACLSFPAKCIFVLLFSYSPYCLLTPSPLPSKHLFSRLKDHRIHTYPSLQNASSSCSPNSHLSPSSFPSKHLFSRLKNHKIPIYPSLYKMHLRLTLLALTSIHHLFP